MGAAALLLASAALANAQGMSPGRVYTFSGEDLGALNLQDITESDSSVRFTGAGDISRRQVSLLRDRRVELVTLRNNSSLVLTVLDRRINFGPASYDPAPGALSFLGHAKILTDLGFAFDASAVKRAGTVVYEAQTTNSATCFIYAAFLGDGIYLTRQIHGAACYLRGDRTTEEVEREMLSLLARARFARASNPSDFSVTLEIPASRLASAPIAPAIVAALSE